MEAPAAKGADHAHAENSDEHVGHFDRVVQYAEDAGEKNNSTDSDRACSGSGEAASILANECRHAGDESEDCSGNCDCGQIAEESVEDRRVDEEHAEDSCSDAADECIECFHVFYSDFAGVIEPAKLSWSASGQAGKGFSHFLQLAIKAVAANR